MAAIGTWPPMTLRSRCAPSRTHRRSALGARQCVRAPLARLASCRRSRQRSWHCPLLPVRLRSGFPLGDYQREFLVPGIAENRHRFTAIYRLGLLALRGGCCLARGMPALDRGGFCADLLTEGLAFVGMPAKMLLSKAGCKRAIVNRKLLPQRKSSPLANSLLARTNIPRAWSNRQSSSHRPFMSPYSVQNSDYRENGKITGTPF